MGDNLLMKNILLSLFISVAAIYASDELTWVNDQVDAIKPPRKGESTYKISKIQDPFIFLKKNAEKGFKGKKNSKAKTAIKKVRSSKRYRSSSSSRKVRYLRSGLKLSAIINNSALINGKWYKLGDKIDYYKIAKINNQSVTLKYKTRTRVLTTKSKEKLKFKR